ncbi:hypothetical protein TeGR_g1888 [Tetraparma gracilis]|uniref:Uncharacterized protein n=1 Tax=Tetraparma gracilis TaxID=2962635 RepID=A0ABQ6N989_9STRA|nr:hypothetical protein TeGR_g1888 [Tetraparma gracilis]
MTSFGTRTRAVAAVLIFLLSPLLSHYASSFAASYPLTALAAFICLSVAYAKLLEGTDKKKGLNLALVAVPVLAWCFFEAITAELPLPNIPLAQNATKLELELHPLPFPPAVPPGSTCRWHQDSNVWPLDLSSYNSSSPPPSLLPSSFLRSSVCLDDYSGADHGKLEGVIDAMDMIAVAAGVGDDEWQKNECKAHLKSAARLATTPYCSPSSCAPLGFCDSDCHTGREFCGRLTDYDGVIDKVLPGGEFHAVVGGMVGAELLPCAVKLLQLVSGGGDDSKICNSSSSTFSNMAFGSTPYVDCLPLSVDDPNSFLRDSSSSGSCALSNWDVYAADFDDVTSYNDALLLNATNVTAADETAEEPPPRFPSWREPALVLIPPVTFLLLWAGDRLSVKKKAVSDNLATVTPVLDGAPATGPSSLAGSYTFLQFFGFAGAFVAASLLALGALAMYIGYTAEQSKDIHSLQHLQVILLHSVGLLAIFYWFSSVMSWRAVVNNLVDVHEGRVDPLAGLSKFPVAKNLMKWYHDNFAIHTAGRYSLLLVIGAEVFEFVVQTSNANFLAKFLDWKLMELYFKDGLLSGATCGLGVDQSPSRDTWELDVNWCGVKTLGEWRMEYADLEVLDLSNNELVELPRWLGDSSMGKLRELRARGNKVEAFVDGMLGGGNTTLVKVDLRDNKIAELAYELMNVESKNTTLLFDGNPCAEEVDWSGLGKDRLPVRMGAGYNNGGFSRSLRVLKMGWNELDESVFGELVAANFTNIEVLDLSWNALGGIEEEEVRGLKRLTKLDVSGNEGISAEDLVATPEGLEMLNASFCGVNEITGEQAVELQDRNMVLHGNPVTEITWAYQGALTKIPAWLRTLEKVTYANLEYCDVKEMEGGAFPASLEELNIKNQVAGLRLHPDSFEGLSNLWWLEASTNKITEDDMHPGLFAGATSLRQIYILGNMEMRRFNATELFPGGSKTLRIAYVRVWHGAALGQGEVAALYQEREAGGA